MITIISLQKKVWLAPILAISLSLTACGGTETSTTASVGSGKSVSLTGAGASFPAPLYQTWFEVMVHLDRQ